MNPLLKKLTPRQKEIAKLLATGISDTEIAKKLGVTRSTVKNTNQTIFIKLGVENRTQAALLIAGAK